MAQKGSNRNPWVEMPGTEIKFRVALGNLQAHLDRGYVLAKAPVDPPVGTEPVAPSVETRPKPGPKPRTQAEPENKTPETV